MKTKRSEFNTFRDLAGKLFSVPHAEIKAKLEVEKTAKKRKKTKDSSASREAV